MDLRVADSEARQKYTKCHSTVRKYLDKASKYKYNGNKSSWDRKCHDNMFYLESASDVRIGREGRIVSMFGSLPSLVIAARCRDTLATIVPWPHDHCL